MALSLCLQGHPEKVNTGAMGVGGRGPEGCTQWGTLSSPGRVSP